MSVASALKSNDPGLLPGKRDEDWRWTDLRGLLRTLPPAAGEADLASLPQGAFDAEAGERRFVCGGRETVEFEVPAGEAATVALRVISRDGKALAGRVSIRVGAHGKLRLFETYEGDDTAYVTHVALKLDAGEGAAVERIVLGQDGADGVTVSQADVTLAAGSEFGQTTVTSGARRQRLETRVVHPGAAASLRLDGLYLLRDQRHADLTTVVEHVGPGGTTSQLAKGVVRDQSRAVFQGRIVVQEGSDRTDARMGHHALILSDRAEVDSRPELLIHADEVQCAHGNTIGALDDDVLFYMRQRGLPQDMARALMMEAFVGEVADRIWFEAARDAVRGWIAADLEG